MPVIPAPGCPDYALGTTFDFKFNTTDVTSAPITLAGTPSLTAYVDNSTTESATGLTLSVDFDSRTGMHNVRVVATGGNGFATGSHYTVVIAAGTVDGISATYKFVGQFTIGKQSALRPATDGRTLVVDANGLADANTVKLGPTGSGTAQTARDIGASVLLSSGTGTGQVNLSSGVVDADMVKVSTDATAADNFETMLDGTGGKTLSLKMLDINNASGSAISAVSSGGNGHGMYLASNGSGTALLADASAGTGRAAWWVAGNSTTAHAFHIQSQNTAHALFCEAAGTGAGIVGDGGGANPGIWGIGGSASPGGIGILAQGLNTAYGFTATGDGGGASFAGTGAGTPATAFAFGSGGQNFRLVLAQPSSVFTWPLSALDDLIVWLGAISTNKITETATTQTLRNRADSSSIATATVSDDGTTGVRGSFS